MAAKLPRQQVVRPARRCLPAYAIDDQTAINVIDGDVEVVSEGN
jgi:hypothetical protein